MLAQIFLLLVPLAAAKKTNGCGKPASLTSDTYTYQDHQYLLHLPPNYDQNDANGSPLIIAFPGYGGESGPIAKKTQYNNDKINKNYVSVFPEPKGNRKTWEGQFPSNTDPVQPDDVAFVNDFITMLSNKLCLDDTRLFASGFSNGGGFTNSLACDPTVGPQFAAFGIHSGAFWTGSEDLNNNNNSPGTGCEPGNRDITPILEIHGLDDDTIHYYGNNGTLPQTQTPYILDWLQRWARRNGCTNPANPRSEPVTGGGATYYHYNAACSTMHYAVEGLSHDWSDKPPYAVDATTKFLNFFDKYTL